jgi:hypothetical protein
MEQQIRAQDEEKRRRAAWAALEPMLSAGKRGGLEASRAKVVGGVVIKTEGLGVETWIDALARDLAARAASSTRARTALERLVM